MIETRDVISLLSEIENEQQPAEIELRRKEF